MIKNIVFSKEVLEFVSEAKQYCDILETSSELDKDSFIDQIIQILPNLYNKTIFLPEFNKIYDEPIETAVTEYDWQYIKNGINYVLGEVDMYVDNFDDQMNELPEPSVFSISENLADIYQDLKNLLEIYKLGDENLSNDALSECYENFKNYWGFKLVSSIKILHLIKFSNYNSSEYFTKYNKDEWLINKAQKDFRKNE